MWPSAIYPAIHLPRKPSHPKAEKLGYWETGESRTLPDTRSGGASGRELD